MSPIMKFSLLPILVFFTVAFVVTDAALPPELYWKSMLPTTPIPKSITDLLHHPAGESSTVHSFVDLPNILINYGDVYPNIFINYGQSKTQELQDDPSAAIFFLENDLKPGHRMNLLFMQTSNQASFLPREVVKSIPFSSSKMAEMLNKFAVMPGSVEANVMKKTIQECEESGIKGEEKYCATSLESMVDFITAKLGKNVEALSMEVMKETKKQDHTKAGREKREYTIVHGVKKVGEAKVAVCHKLNYVYAVFYCHKIENTIAYTVPLEGSDLSRVKAVSVCHKDTSKWNPKHLAFLVLKVKPGSAPVCHFLSKDSVLWVSKEDKA